MGVGLREIVGVGVAVGVGCGVRVGIIGVSRAVDDPMLTFALKLTPPDLRKLINDMQITYQSNC